MEREEEKMLTTEHTVHQYLQLHTLLLSINSASSLCLGFNVNSTTVVVGRSAFIDPSHARKLRAWQPVTEDCAAVIAKVGARAHRGIVIRLTLKCLPIFRVTRVLNLLLRYL